MNVEIVEFYPLDRNDEKGSLSGTLRIRLPDIGVHILGIFVTRRKGTWFFSLPGKLGTHHETGESIRFPFITFEDREKQRELVAAIREAGPGFIEKRMVDTENPLVWPVRQRNLNETSSHQPKVDDAAEVKNTSATKISRPAPVRSIPIDQFRDPPKRETTAYGNRRK